MHYFEKKKNNRDNKWVINMNSNLISDQVLNENTNNETSKGLFTIIITNCLVLLACATMRHMIEPWYEQIRGNNNNEFNSLSDTKGVSIIPRENTCSVPIEIRSNASTKKTKMAHIEMKLKEIQQNLNTDCNRSNSNHSNSSSSNSSSVTSVETNHEPSITRFPSEDVNIMIPNKETVVVNKDGPMQKMCSFRDNGYDRDNEESIASSVLDTIDQ